jgi:hypothetical protein
MTGSLTGTVRSSNTLTGTTTSSSNLTAVVTTGTEQFWPLIRGNGEYLMRDDGNILMRAT